VLIGLCIALAFVVYSSPARATTTTWTGNGDGSDWFDADNWDHGVPTYSADAVVNTGKAEINGSGAVARTLTLGTGEGDEGTVVVSGGALTVGSGTRPCSGSIAEGAPLGLSGSEGVIVVGYGGTGTLQITNGGTVSSEAGFIAFLGGVSSIVQSTGTVTVDGENSAWTLGGCIDWRLSVSGPPYTSDDGGTAILSVTNGGQVIVNNPLGGGGTPVTFVGISGTLTGGSAIIVNGIGRFPSAVNIAGTLAPTGTLTVKGSLVLSSHDGSATTLCYATPGGADMVDVKATPTATGEALLGGHLIVTLSGTFSHGEGSCTTRFTLLHAAGGIDYLHPEFAVETILGVPLLNPPYSAQINYDTNNVYLDLTFNNCEE